MYLGLEVLGLPWPATAPCLSNTHPLFPAIPWSPGCASRTRVVFPCTGIPGIIGEYCRRSDGKHRQHIDLYRGRRVRMEAVSGRLTPSFLLHSSFLLFSKGPRLSLSLSHPPDHYFMGHLSSAYSFLKNLRDHLIFWVPHSADGKARLKVIEPSCPLMRGVTVGSHLASPGDPDLSLSLPQACLYFGIERSKLNWSPNTQGRFQAPGNSLCHWPWPWWAASC